MSSARNKVIAGKFDGKYIKYKLLDSYPVISNVSSYDAKGIGLNGYNELEIRKSNITQYEIITEEHMKSGTSAIMRGALGAAVLGPVGILAGLTAKNKSIHTIAIEWKDGNKSLIEVDDKIYKVIITELF